ncbi:MAG: TatD family hydrolase [Treponema sp.]|jgi:TatD DNase family protein|nr:TatD family hydrolase [Treponema sp.]
MTDAHCHPFDLLTLLSTPEEERRKTGTACAANSCNLKEFEYIEGLSKKAEEEKAPRLFRCFALHPQLSGGGDYSPDAGLELLGSLAAEGRLDAVGETGFDLYDARYRAGEKLQERMFACHLETALRYGLPMVLHVRRAIHKIFPFTNALKKVPAVIFHSWPGTGGEGEALLRRGVNVFFSFGTIVLKNHRQAMASVASFPSDRILLETDAPYQPLRGKAFSSWADLSEICQGVARLRREAGSLCDTPDDVEAITTANFYRAFVPKIYHGAR